MPVSSAYNGFDVMVRADNGAVTQAAAATVKVYDKTNDVVLPDLASDAFGHVTAGTLPVAVGTLIYFSALLPDGRCGWAKQVTF